MNYDQGEIEQGLDPVEKEYPAIKWEERDYAGRVLPMPQEVLEAVRAYEAIKSEWKRQLQAAKQGQTEFSDPSEILLEGRPNPQGGATGRYLVVNFGDHGDGRSEPDEKLKILAAMVKDASRYPAIMPFLQEFTVEKEIKK